MLPAKFKYPVPQTDPPRPPRETLPTMYDLPSENPEEPGLPDEFHDLQPQLLSATLRLGNYAPNRIFTGTDINLYYDIRHPLWYKRPDWFVVPGASRLYEGTDLRSSYVIWQEGISPFVVVELLSPGTQDEDLGQTVDRAEPEEVEEPGVEEPEAEQLEAEEEQVEKPPRKWEVYEQILRVPYYLVFDRYTDQLRAFVLQGGSYQERNLTDAKLWMPELGAGLGLWYGTFQGITRLWLRWYDRGGWLPTDSETAQREADLAQQQVQAERQRTETERQRAEQLAAELSALRQRLQERGIDPGEL